MKKLIKEFFYYEVKDKDPIILTESLFYPSKLRFHWVRLILIILLIVFISYAIFKK